ERATEGRRRVERPQLEREQGRAVLLLPEGGREHRGHHQIHERAVLLDDRQVLDQPGQLGRLTRLFANDARYRSSAEFVVGGKLGPKGDQRREAELTPERERRRIHGGRPRNGGRTRRQRPRHTVILPTSAL